MFATLGEVPIDAVGNAFGHAVVPGNGAAVSTQELQLPSATFGAAPGDAV